MSNPKMLHYNDAGFYLRWLLPSLANDVERCKPDGGLRTCLPLGTSREIRMSYELSIQTFWYLANEDKCDVYNALDV